MKRISVIGLVGLLALSAPVAAQTTWYVDASGVAPGSGTENDPFVTIQDAIDSASSQTNDTVLVAPNVYFENLDFLGKPVSVEATGPGAGIDGSDLGSVVRFVSGEGSASRLVGFTIVNGIGDVDPVTMIPTGGGIRIVSSSPTITDCQIRANGNGFSPQYGGGIYIENGSPTITGTFLESNFSCSEGGGIAIFGGSPVIDDCFFLGNITNSFPGLVQGGGLYSTGMPTISNCKFEFNLSDRGGGMAGSGHVVDSSFNGNQSSWGGAAYQVTLLERCVFVNNRAECYFAESGIGGGAAAECTLVDCSVFNNVATVGGGVLDCAVTDSSLFSNRAEYTGNCFGLAAGGGAKDSTLVRCTVTSNWVDPGFGLAFPGSGGGLDGGSAEECLFRGNTADAGGGVANAQVTRCTVFENQVRLQFGGGYLVDANSSIFDRNQAGELDPASTADWSIVRGGFPGVANLDVDPKLWAPVSGADHAPLPGSPAIDAADPALPLDSDGTRAEIGALTFDPSYIGSPGAFCSGKYSSFGCSPSLSGTGNASLTASDFTIDFFGVQPNVNGLLFLGLAPAAIPFLGGTLCVNPPLKRTPTQDSGSSGMFLCTGSYSFSVDSALLTEIGLAPYEQVYAQCWHRDPPNPDGTGVVLTSAMEFVALP